jgi:3-phytase
MMKKFIPFIFLVFVLFVSCQSYKKGNTVIPEIITPEVITAKTKYDTDDPAIWINPNDISKSLIIGTDKDSDGALYVYDLQGNIVNIVADLKRPNNVDVAYGMAVGDSLFDIAVATERETNSIRIFSLPDMKALDNGGIPVFVDQPQRAPMGIALYTKKDSFGNNRIFAIVSRKEGPIDGYLFQYLLKSDSLGIVTGELVRQFGKYSGKKEIESVAVDNELGFVYYSDEQTGVRKYHADPALGNEELALFADSGFKEDNEGISIYKKDQNKGYILVSNQSKNSFMVYPREGKGGNPHLHPLIAEIPVKATQSDGSDVSNMNFGEPFTEGIFVAMSDDKTFHFYDWRKFQKLIDEMSEK